MLIEDDSILRRIPHIMNPRQALLLEALTYCIDSLEVTVGTIVNILTQYGEMIPDQDRTIRIRLFIDAWSIVDNIHNARKLLSAFGADGPKTQEFQRTYKVAKQLRDGMDHLTDNARNLAAKKKADPPLVGHLAYNYIPRNKIIQSADGAPEVIGGYMISLSIGSFGHRDVAAEFINPATPGSRVHGSIMGLKIGAFGHSLEIFNSFHDLLELVRHLERSITEQIEGRAKEAAENGQGTYEEMTVHYGNGFSAVAEWSAMPPPEPMAVGDSSEGQP